MNDFYPMHRTKQMMAQHFGLFDDIVSKALGSSSRAPSLLAQLHPWRENDEKSGYVWQILAAGLDQSDVSVELEDDTVIVELKSANTQKKVQVTLPHLAKKDTLSAELSKGILTLAIEKAEKKRTAIEVKSTDQRLSFDQNQSSVNVSETTDNS